MAQPTLASEKALQKVADHLSCPVCLDDYQPDSGLKQPRVLPCLHVYCQECLGRLQVSEGGKETARCPTCRRVYPLPEGGAAALPSAFFIHHLFEVRDILQRARQPDKVQCEKCGEGEVRGFCRDCAKFVCQVCVTMHKRWDELKSHVIVTLDEVQSTAASLKPAQKVTTKCSKHPKKTIKIYCGTCSELICRDCTVKTHHGHNCDLMSDALPRHKKIISDSLKPLREQLGIVAAAMAEVGECAVRLQGEGEETKERVSKTIDDLVAILLARKAALVAEVDRTVGVACKALSAQLEEFELTHTQLASCTAYVEGSLESGTPEEVLGMEAQVVARVDQLAAEFDSSRFQLQPQNHVYVTFPDLTAACQIPGSVATTREDLSQVLAIYDASSCRASGVSLNKDIVGVKRTLAVHTVDASGRKCSLPSSCVAANLSCPGQGPVQCRVVGKAEGVWSVEYTAPSAGQYQLSITVCGQHIRDSPYTVQASTTLDIQGVHVRSITGLKGPKRMAFTREGDIVVAEHNASRVAVFTRQGQKKTEIEIKKTEMSSSTKPHAVAVTPDNHLLVTVGRTLRRYTMQGELVQSVGADTVGKQFRTPFAVAVNQTSGVVYVTDSLNSQRVHIFNPDLTHIRSIGGAGQQAGKFNFPLGIAVRPSGNVLVADCYNHRVQEFSAGGEFLRVVGEGRLKEPGSVTTDDKDYMYILAQSPKNSVSIFNHEGKYIKSFGSQGEKEGEFNVPYGIALDHDGYPYVCDFGNSCIQVFK